MDLDSFRDRLCPKCKWTAALPCGERRWFDGVLARARITPFRCRSCRYRFYVFAEQFAQQALLSNTETSTTPEQGGFELTTMLYVVFCVLLGLVLLREFL